MPTCILVAAYGRKYLSVHAALKDWNAGKDFRIVGGPYCSIRDIDSMREMFGAIVLSVRGQTMYLWEAWKEML